MLCYLQEIRAVTRAAALPGLFHHWLPLFLLRQGYPGFKAPISQPESLLSLRHQPGEFFITCFPGDAMCAGYVEARCGILRDLSFPDVKIFNLCFKSSNSESMHISVANLVF